MTSNGGTSSSLDALTCDELPDELPDGLLDELDGPLDAMLDGPLVGARLFGGAGPAIGRYVIAHRMGAGATSIVYAAHDTVLDRPVALKIVAPRDLDGAWSEHARDEARALARLDHENVVAVYDVGAWRGHPFIAMQLVAGVTLAQWQAARHRTWPEILRHYLAAARGLDAAHSVGLVHRDFKPMNVLVAGNGRVLVTDFGLAALTAPTPAAGAAHPGAKIGTLRYRAPEQHAGATPRPSADVYSFSVALCEALLGRHPLADAAFDWRRALAQLALPQRARTAIEHGMAPDPAQRWPRLGPLLADLERALPEPPAHPAAPLGRLRGRATGPLLALGIGIATGVHAGSARPPEVARVMSARELAPSDPTAAAQLLLEIPASERGDDWVNVARIVLMRPIARELRCFGGAASSIASVAHGLAVALDPQAGASLCELATERTVPLQVPGAPLCARVLDGDHVGVLAADGGLAIFARAAGWRRWGTVRLAPPPPGAARPDAWCEHELTSLGPRTLAIRLEEGWGLVDLSAPRAPDTPAAASTVRASTIRAAAGDVLAGLSRDRRRALVLGARGELSLAPVDGAAAIAVPAIAVPAIAVPAIAVPAIAVPAIAVPGGAAPIRRIAHDPISGVAVAISGELGAVIDVESGTVYRREDLALPAPDSSLELAPGGRTVAVAMSGSGLVLWWSLDGSAPPPRLEALSDHSLAQLAFNPAGTRLVWRDSNGALGVREVGSARAHELSVDGRSVCHVTFVTNDRVAAVTCDGRVLAWDLDRDRAPIVGRHDLAHCWPECAPQSSAIWWASVSADRSTLATAGRDGTVGLWPLGDAVAEPARLPIGPGRRSFLVLIDGDLLLVTHRDAVAQLWNWRTRQLVADLPGHEAWGYAVAVAHPAPGLTVFATGSRTGHPGDGKVQLWRADGSLLAADRIASRVNDLAASPDGRLIAAALTSGSVAIYDTATGTRRALIPVHRGWARRVLFADNAILISAGDDGYVARIEVASGRVAPFRAHRDKIYDMDLRGSLLLTGSHDATIRLWDLRDGSLVHAYVGHTVAVQVVRWHPDGRRFVSGDGDLLQQHAQEGSACIWRIDRDTCQSWLLGHRADVRAAQFLDDERVVTASYDGTVRIWTPMPPATPDELAAELAQRAPACLDARQRMKYLHEAPATATARAIACRAAGA